MIINIILWILMALAIIGFLNSVRIEWTEKRNSSEFAVKWLMKKLSKEGATNVIHANETGMTFVGNDTFYYLDWPMNDSNGNNTMATLYISQGQEIENLQLPSETQIVVKPDDGGSEGTGDEEITP